MHSGLCGKLRVTFPGEATLEHTVALQEVPTIIELFKSHNHTNWMKVGDVGQVRSFLPCARHCRRTERLQHAAVYQVQSSASRCTLGTCCCRGTLRASQTQAGNKRVSMLHVIPDMMRCMQVLVVFPIAPQYDLQLLIDAEQAGTFEHEVDFGITPPMAAG